MADRRIKVTGYYTPDEDSHIDENHPSGLTAEGFDALSEELLALEDIETELE